MKTLYAVTFFVCLSLSALADVLDITPIAGVEDSIATSMPPPQTIEDHSVRAAVDFYVDEYHVGPVTTPAIKPIEGAEFEGTSRDDAPTLRYSIDTMIEDDDYTAVSPATPKIEDKPINSGLDFSLDNEPWEFKLPETIGRALNRVGRLALHTVADTAACREADFCDMPR
jgi:hypothetical protein